jgi:phosphotransferase system HPr (HPr) family protein
MKVFHKLLVQNEHGLHARPAAHIAKLLQPFESSVFFTYNLKKVNAKQIMDLLLLGATKNALIEIEIAGLDAKLALERLIFAFESHFEERNK